MTAYAEIAPPAPSRRASLWRLTTVELRKMADTRAGFWLLVVCGLIAVGLVGIVVGFGNEQDKELESMLSGTLGATSVLLPVVGILLVTSEWSQRTALATFTLVPERERVVASKFFAGILFSVAASAVCLLFSVIGTAIAGGDMSLSASAVANGLLYQGLGLVMGMGLGLALLSSPLAIVLYFVLPTVIAIIFQSINALNEAGEWVDTSSTFQPLVENEMGSGDWSRLAVSAGIWLLIPLAVGLVRLRRSELK
jgi:ABC-2 type transport system permease protein